MKVGVANDNIDCVDFYTLSLFRAPKLYVEDTSHKFEYPKQGYKRLGYKDIRPELIDPPPLPFKTFMFCQPLEPYVAPKNHHELQSRNPGAH